MNQKNNIQYSHHKFRGEWHYCHIIPSKSLHTGTGDIMTDRITCVGAKCDVTALHDKCIIVWKIGNSTLVKNTLHETSEDGEGL